MTTVSAACQRLAQTINTLLATRPHVLVGIDGRCGSGKSTLGDALARRLEANLLHTDDYYLPFDRRIPGWETVPAANMDFDRLCREVIEPALGGEAILSHPYRCMDGVYLPETRLPPRPVTVVEGSYSHHPALGKGYDLRIFVTCDPAVQERRLRAREGEYYPMFPARWIPLEEGYFRQYAIEEKADVTLELEG